MEQITKIQTTPTPLPFNKYDVNRLKKQSQELERITLPHILPNLKPTMTVADVGCGNGDMVLYLLDKVTTIYAIDQDQGLLDVTKANVEEFMEKQGLKFANVIYILWNVTEPDLNNCINVKSLDLIFVRLLLVNVNVDFHNAIITNLTQKLKIGGKLLLEESFIDNICIPGYEHLTNEYKDFLNNIYKPMNCDLNTGTKLTNLLVTRDDYVINYFDTDKSTVDVDKVKEIYDNFITIMKLKFADDPEILNKFTIWSELINEVAEQKHLRCKVHGLGLLTATLIK